MGIKFKEHWHHMLVVLMMWLEGTHRTMKYKGHLGEDGCVPSQDFLSARSQSHAQLEFLLVVFNGSRALPA